MSEDLSIAKKISELSGKDIDIPPKWEEARKLVDRARQFDAKAAAYALEGIRCKWKVGRILRQTSDYGERVAEAFHGLIRGAYSVAYIESWMRLGKLSERELEDLIERGYRTIKALLGQVGEKERVLGLPEQTEEAAKGIIKKAEELTHEAEALLDRFWAHTEDRLPPDVRDQLEGVRERVRQEKEAILVARSHPIEQQGPWRSAWWRQKVCEFGCVVDGRPAEPHHLRIEGKGIKGTDASCIPLCHEHHLEAQANVTFWIIHWKELLKWMSLAYWPIVERVCNSDRGEEIE